MKFLNHPRSAPSGRDGFTLVEIMIAIVLGAMILAGGFMALRTGFTILEQARDNTRVTQILQSEMERLRSMRFEDIGALPAKAQFTPQGGFTNAFADRYTLTRVIEEGMSSSQYRVTITAQWEVHGVTKTQQFSSLFTEDGLYDYYYRTF